MVLLIFIIDEVVTKFQTKVPKPFLDFFVPEKKKKHYLAVEQVSE